MKSNQVKSKQAIFYNEDDFDFSGNKEPKIGLFAVSKKSTPNQVFSSPSINAKQIDEIFSTKSSNLMDLDNQTLTPSTKGSTSNVALNKEFSFDDKFKNKETTDNVSAISAFNFDFNNFTTKKDSINNLALCHKSSSSTNTSSKNVLGNESNELKHKIINSNLVDINNILDNNLKSLVPKNSLFSGTPLNRIEVNTNTNVNFQGKIGY